MKEVFKTGANQPLLAKVTEAKSLKQRMIGLLQHSKLNDDEGMLIYSTNSIHTFFMKFAIDVVFLDKNFKVVDLLNNVVPWRITLPRIKAKHVLEIRAGLAQDKRICIGDNLNVGH